MSLRSHCLVLLLAAICCTVVSADLAWWQKAVFYQIYPRSYQDTDGDGIGDLRGMMEHVEYLKDIGVDAIWMNPIYDSPLKDFGYDISNYTSIDKTFGTFDDFAALVKKIHDLGMYILVDMVPNHSSNEHPWFIKSENNEPGYEDFYVWDETAVFHNKPNNWMSVMGGPAWEWSKKRGTYYYHAFLKEQPDLNYRNKKVVEAMKDVLTFWLDRGVDGFRVDAVPYLVEDSQFRDNPPCVPASPGCIQSTYTQNQVGTYEVLADFQAHLQNYSNPKFPGEKIMVTEVYADIRTVQNYFEYNGRKTSTMPFNFELISINRETIGTTIKQMVDKWETNLIKDGWSNWVTGNHDQNRVGKKVGLPMTDGMNMLVLLLPGTSFSYYGEELGMDDTYIMCNQMQDIQAIRQAGSDCAKMESLSRDPERTPMQWNTSRYAGFSTHKPWLPVNPNFYECNVDVQKADPRSHLNIYKHLISLKKEMIGCKNMTTVVSPDGKVFGFKRFGCKNETDNYYVILNFNNDESTINFSRNLTETSELFVRVSNRLSQRKSGDKVSLDNLTLRPKESLVLSTKSSAPLLMPSFTLFVTLLVYIIKMMRQC